MRYGKEMKEKFVRLAEEHGTALLIIDHDAIRENYRRFKGGLERIQAYNLSNPYACVEDCENTGNPPDMSQ